MKNVLSLYVLKRFMTQLALMLAALTGILLLFDLLANAEDITAENEQVFFPLIFYMMLRLPALISLIIPMSVLMASIMTFAKLASEREMIAMENAGVTLYRVLGVIMCGVIFVGAHARRFFLFGQASIVAAFPFIQRVCCFHTDDIVQHYTYERSHGFDHDLCQACFGT